MTRYTDKIAAINEAASITLDHTSDARVISVHKLLVDAYGPVASNVITHLVDALRQGVDWQARGKGNLFAEGLLQGRKVVLADLIEHRGGLDEAGIWSKAQDYAELIVLREFQEYENSTV